eukprot:4951047-Amphidinium_carterae.3
MSLSRRTQQSQARAPNGLLLCKGVGSWPHRRCNVASTALTQRARENNPRIYALWMAILAKLQFQRKWQVLENEEAFVAEKNTAIRSKRSPKVIAIAADDAEMGTLNNKLASVGGTADKRSIFLLPSMRGRRAA